MQLPTRWSYSALSTWEECPARYAYDYVYKLEGPGPGPAAERGLMLHKMAEDYVKGTITTLPFDLRKIKKQVENYRERRAIAEDVWTVDRQWCAPNVKFTPWVKAVIDVHYVDGDKVVIRDYKSGREYPSHKDQLELYGILGLIKYPGIYRADLAADYIDGGFTGCDESIIRPMLPKLIEKWEGKAIMMMEDRTWIARPGFACKWCPHAKGKGGPCADSAKAGQ